MTTESKCSTVALAAVLFFVTVAPARAFDLRNPRQQRNLPPQALQQLEDQLSDRAQPYMSAEDTKKDSGKKYVDLQQKFEYLPNYGPNGQVVVSAKLGGAEYDPSKDKSNPKGQPTGVLKYLVFTYALEHGKWVEEEKPRWEQQDLGKAAAAHMRMRSDQVAKIQAERKRLADQAAEKKAQAEAKKAVEEQAKAEAAAKAKAAQAGASPAAPEGSPTP